MSDGLTHSLRRRIDRYSRAGLREWQHERRDLIRELMALGYSTRAIGGMLQLAHNRVLEISKEDRGRG